MRLINLLVVFLLCGEAQASSQDEAVKTAMLAAYKQTGMEGHVTRTIEEQVPKKFRIIAGHVGNVINVIVNQKVEYSWNF
jgi:hypothetical protein